ncbi:MAG: DUF2608 domain-containing protein [Waddliaceae bacterium]
MIILIFVISLFSSLSCEIVEKDEILTLTPSIDSRTLVLIDLDNTVMRPKTMLGSAQHIWFETLAMAEKEGISIQEAKEKAGEEWNRLQPYLEMIPTDPFLPDWISLLQRRGVYIFGITRRPPELENVTREQLKSIGVAFAPNEILFCGGCTNKSENLKQFLIGLVFEKMIFIDDVPSNVTDMEQFANELEIDYLGVRYSREDQWVESYDPKVIEDEKESFLKKHPSVL